MHCLKGRSSAERKPKYKLDQEIFHCLHPRPEPH